MFGRVAGAGFGFFALLLSRGDAVSAQAVLMHWTLWSAVMFALLGAVRCERAADTVAEVLVALASVVMVLVALATQFPSANGYRGARGDLSLWPLLWMVGGFALIWLTQPER